MSDNGAKFLGWFIGGIVIYIILMLIEGSMTFYDWSIWTRAIAIIGFLFLGFYIFMENNESA